MNNETKFIGQNMNLSAMVPVDEQAVEQVVPMVVAPTSLTVGIPQEEQAIPDEERVDALSSARAKGLFNPAYGMANLHNVLGDRVYAAIQVDEQGRRFIEFCERYRDGSFSPKMRIAQSDVFMLQMYNSPSEDRLAVKMRNKATNFVVKLSEEYLAKFNGEEPLEMFTLLNALIAVRNDLPVCSNEPEIQPAEEFYSQVVENIKRIPCEFNHKAYYALSGEQFDYLADLMEMKKPAFLKKLREYNLLYLTESSKGYQTNVRIKCEKMVEGLKEDFFDNKDSYTQWSYCIYKMEFLGNNFAE